MTALLLNLAALGAAPFVHRLSGRAPALEAALDAALRALVFGLVAGQLLPQGLVLAGWAALAGAAAGAAFPLLLERNPALLGSSRSTIALGLVFAALIAHSFVDGVGLAAGSTGSALALAIVLHTLPLGLIVWHGLVPRYGQNAGILALVAAGAATAAGFLLPGVFVPESALSWGLLGVLPALVGGSLLHAIAHPWKDGIEEGPGRWASGLGAVAGITVAAVVVLAEPIPPLPPSELALSGAMVAVASLGAPALLLGTAIAALGSVLGRTPVAVLGWVPGAVVAGALLGPWVGLSVLLVGVAQAWTSPETPDPPTSWAVLRDTVDPVLPWWVFGTTVAAALEPWLGVASGLPAIPAALAGAAVGAVLKADVVAIAPIAAVLVHKGLPLPAAAACAAAAAWRTSPVLSAMIGVASAGVVWSTGWVAVPPLHAVALAPPAIASLAAIGLLAGWSLVRRGLTGFLAPVLHPRVRLAETG